MESLYVCQFSSGQIKVGRSTDPQSRIAAHADRVSCMGVELSDSHVIECAGPAAPREARLIAQCAEAATARHQNEWFSGLDFLTVCEWANTSAVADITADRRTFTPNSFGARLRFARQAAGLTQADIGKGLGVAGDDLNKAAVSSWEVGRSFPNVCQLRTLCLRLGVTADSLVFNADEQVAPESASDSAKVGA